MSTFNSTNISFKKHKILKLTYENEVIKCMKIFAFEQSQVTKISLITQHFENIREYIRRNSSGKSFLGTFNKIEIRFDESVINHKRYKYIKVISEYSTIQIFSKYLQSSQQQFNKNIHAYLSYFCELFQMILRGLPILNFFYSPSNVFFERNNLMNEQNIRLDVNILSTVGLQLIYLKNDILRQDLEQIFGLLPKRLDKLIQNKDYKQINRIIWMKALGWNILCYIVQYVPNILINMNLNVMISYQQVRNLLQRQHQLVTQLLLQSEYNIRIAQKITGIQLMVLLKDILINDCQNIGWQSIYNHLFVNNTRARYNQYKNISNLKLKDKYNNENMSRYIINYLWSIQNQQIKQTYRRYSIQDGSKVYFLIKSKIKFNKIIQFTNIINLLLYDDYCSDKIKIHYQFMKSFNIYKQLKFLHQLKFNKIQQNNKMMIPYYNKTNKHSQKICIIQNGNIGLHNKIINGKQIHYAFSQNQKILNNYNNNQLI